MRATDVATRETVRTPVRASVLAWSALLGAIVGALLVVALVPADAPRFEARLDWPHPAPQHWPRTPQVGEFARVEATSTRRTLVVSAPTAAQARGLAREFATYGSPTPGAIAARREAIVDAWRAELVVGPQPEATPATEVAAWLLARARWGRVLAGELPVASAQEPLVFVEAPLAVRAAWTEVERAARTGDAVALEGAIVEASHAESRWFVAPEAWVHASSTAKAEAWRRWQIARAATLEGIAAEVLGQQTPFQRRLAASVARERLVALVPRLVDPWTAFAAPEPRSLRPVVQPRVVAWLRPVGIGVGLGVACALCMVLLFSLLQPRLPIAPPFGEVATGATPALAGPRVHVVCGLERRATFRAAFEVAAHALARGERVLLVDGSDRWALHEPLGADARWGLLESLAADLPVLGLVQYAGAPGLYLLPHGRPERAVGWSSVGRKLDEVVPHFGRVVLVLDPQAPVELGDALRGRAMEGWWAGAEGRAGRGRSAAVSRFGILFHALGLQGVAEASLEGLIARVEALGPVAEAPVAVPLAVAEPAVPTVVPANPLEPIVLDCDLQVRQRLRFLAWTRRVQAEHRRAELQAT